MSSASGQQLKCNQPGKEGAGGSPCYLERQEPGGRWGLIGFEDPAQLGHSPALCRCSRSAASPRGAPARSCGPVLPHPPGEMANQRDCKCCRVTGWREGLLTRPMLWGLAEEPLSYGSLAKTGRSCQPESWVRLPSVDAHASCLCTRLYIHAACTHSCHTYAHVHTHASHRDTEEEIVEGQKSAQMIPAWTWVQSLREKNLSRLLGSGGKYPLWGSSAPAFIFWDALKSAGRAPTRAQYLH